MPVTGSESPRHHSTNQELVTLAFSKEISITEQLKLFAVGYMQANVKVIKAEKSSLHFTSHLLVGMKDL